MGQRDTMRQGETNLTVEVAQVHRELTAFRDQLLPALLGPCEAYLEDRAQDPSRWPSVEQIEKSVCRPCDIGSWPSTTCSMLCRLPDSPQLTRSRTGPNIKSSSGNATSASSHLMREGRIVWRIELFIGWDDALEYMLARSGAEPMGAAQEPGPDPFAELQRRLPEVKHWFLSLPVDGSVLFNALSYILTPVADLDPAFAKLALDPDTWRSIVRTDQTLDEPARLQRLQAIDHGHLPDAINNALLHVLAALANNHFGAIADFVVLEHPCLSGAYTGLIPHYLFAVLLEEVKTLCSLAKLGNG